MEILSNFASIYCYISFVIGAVFMLASLAIVAMSKDNEPRNNVRFFVTKDNSVFNDDLKLWLGKPEWDKNIVSWITHSRYVHYICNNYYFEGYKLNPADFADMKEGEIREVFLNLED